MRTSILSVIVSAAVGAFAFFGVGSPAMAGTVVISAFGLWGPDAPVTPWSAPDAEFSFSFNLLNPIPKNPTTGTLFSYFLNLTEVTFTQFIPVQFFAADVAGMFDLDLPDGDVLSLYGADIGTSLTIPEGTFLAAAGMQMQPASGIASVTVTPLSVGGVTGFGAGVVPELSTWVMMSLGFAGLAFVGYRASRRRGGAYRKHTDKLVRPDYRLRGNVEKGGLALLQK